MLKNKKWYKIHNHNINAFNNKYNSMYELYNKVSSNVWVNCNNYPEFTKRLKTYDISPEQALIYTNNEIRDYINNDINYNLAFKHVETVVDPYLLLKLKEDIIYVFKFIVSQITENNSRLNLRNINIFIRRYFYNQTYKDIASVYDISVERTRQIIFKEKAKLFYYFRRVNLKDSLILKIFE